MTTETINQEQMTSDVNESVISDNAVKAITAKAETLNKKARRIAAKKNVAVKANTTVKAESFFNVEETEKQLQIEIESKKAVAAAKAAKAEKSSHSEKLLVSSLTRANTHYIYTNTAIVNIALLVAARSIERASCNQIAAYIEKVLKCDNIRHKSDSSNAHRVLAHCKDALAAYVTIENDIITFNELLIKTAKLDRMIANVDQLAAKLIAANS
jgi:hypothetical protein